MHSRLFCSRYLKEKYFFDLYKQDLVSLLGITEKKSNHYFLMSQSAVLLRLLCEVKKLPVIIRKSWLYSLRIYLKRFKALFSHHPSSFSSYLLSSSLCHQKVCAVHGRTTAQLYPSRRPATAPQGATGAGPLPATSPILPHLPHHCPPTVSSPSVCPALVVWVPALQDPMTPVWMSRMAAASSLMSPSLASARWTF